MVGKLMLIILGSFGLHQTYGPSHILGERWGNMFREAVGAVGLWPFVVLIVDDVPKVGDRAEDWKKAFSIAYALTLLFFGSGVLLGHLFDGARKE